VKASYAHTVYLAGLRMAPWSPAAAITCHVINSPCRTSHRLDAIYPYTAGFHTERFLSIEVSVFPPRNSRDTEYCRHAKQKGAD